MEFDCSKKAACTDQFGPLAFAMGVPISNHELAASCSQPEYTLDNFPSYSRLLDLKTPYLSKDRYQRVRERYLGKAVPQQDDPDYKLDIQEFGCSSWLECWIVLAIRCD